MGAQHGTELVRAAQSGDPRAQDRLIALHLPLVYNIVGRAMNGHHDVDDVVQETMLRALAGLGGLRSPDSFRSWLVAITMNGVRGHWHRQQQAGLPAGGLDDAREIAQPGADFVELAVVRLNLSGQRRETAEATRWMEPDDRDLLSLWWLECAGELSRHEVAAALQLSPQHTAVRVQRMKERLEAARVVVRALSQNPPCPTLRYEIDTWDGRPSALWRKRIARHARACAHCAGLWSGLVPAEGLLAGLLLVPPAAMLLAGVRARAGFGTTAATAATARTAMPFGTPLDTPFADPVADPAADPLASSHHGVATDSGPGGGPAGRGPRSSRAARRRRRQRRGRRRAVIAAGIAVVAVTGGAFTLTTGPDEGAEARDTTLAATTGAGLPSPQETTADPVATSTSASPSPSATPTVRKTPKPSRPTPTASRTTPTAAPRPPRTTAPAPAPRPTSTQTTSGSGSGSGSTAQQVISLVNSERAKAGCGPLAEHPLLTKAAQGHSDDMAARDFFDHTNPDGDGPGERITAAGYTWSAYGENIAKGQTTAAQVMESWMNSPGHRANILNCDFKEIGVGIHTAGGPYWTQAFGSR
ncbi:sigma-70 family RNA polymerase sigma factor [Streptomyces sp. NPDC049602]|uniref:sigma-70 family RNA polymerase sigma factor n=1 Tax=Streptomyces sp. NPDC049602 TaxID=3155504 RepID=UPI00343AFF11